MPALDRALRASRIVSCAGNMRQIGIFSTMYAGDSGDFVPMPTSPHLYRLASAVYVVGGPSLICMSSGAPVPPCPDGTSRLYPASFGWFYYLGYMRPGSDIGPLRCPDMDPFRDYGADRIVMEQRWYNTYSTLTRDLANNSTFSSSVWGGNWDCNPGGAFTSYFYRGWARGTVGSTMVRKASQWRGSEAAAVDWEWYDFVSPQTYFQSHGNGVNILFQDGAVFFGGPDINGYPPGTYFSMTVNGYSYTSATTNGSSSGYPYAGQYGFASLWQYYEEFRK
jgi:prepilin-type processing-associated H-X9-DG protein